MIMKKLLTFLCICTLISCSEEPLDDSNSIKLEELKEGRTVVVPEYSNLNTFLKEYEKLSELKSPEEIEIWLNEKGHTSMLSVSDSIFQVSDSLGVIYSDALMSMFNQQGQAKIGDEHVLLNKSTIYSLGSNPKKEEFIYAENLKEFGKIQNFSEGEQLKNPGEYIPNANKWKTYVDYDGSKKYITELYNETLIFSGNAYSSKMYLRFRMDYRSCSFWRCTWKNETSTTRRININITFGGINTWPSAQFPLGYNIINTDVIANGHYNFLIANHNQNGVEYQNFYINGSITSKVIDGTLSGGYLWVLDNISWY